MHGYDMITEFDDRSGVRWRHSPGSVYPTLNQLEDEGLVRSFDDDGRKRFELTDAGRTWLDEHADETSPWERSAAGGRGDMRRLAGEIFGQLRQVGRFGSPAQQDKAREILTRTRSELYAVLAEPQTEPSSEPPTGSTDPSSGPVTPAG
ncbi:MAG: PadR family transcriptional regulator [Ilumatobacteraceae bacterium]